MKSGSNLEKVLKAGHFAFTGECGPPKGANVEHLKEKLEPLRGVVDAVNVTDNQTAVVRMSSAAAIGHDGAKRGSSPTFRWSAGTATAWP
jgi:methylenetetrahydrofolate reductase (NADPH)